MKGQRTQGQETGGGRGNEAPAPTRFRFGKAFTAKVSDIRSRPLGKAFTAKVSDIRSRPPGWAGVVGTASAAEPAWSWRRCRACKSWGGNRDSRASGSPAARYGLGG